MTDKEHVLAAIIATISNAEDRYRVAEAICNVCKSERSDFNRIQFMEAVAFLVKEPGRS